MQIRITKTRAAMAALFVLAGVGLASLLSPLVGTALATAGQIVNISDHSGSAFFAKVRLRREAGRRRRRRPAERGRDGHGSPGCARVSVARKRGHPQTRRVHRRAERVADQGHEPVRSRPTPRAEGDSRRPGRLPRAEQRHELQRSDFDAHALAHPDVGDGVTPRLVHLPDAAAMEATRKHEGVPACVGADAQLSHHDHERRRLLRRLMTESSRRTRDGAPAH